MSGPQPRRWPGTPHARRYAAPLLAFWLTFAATHVVAASASTPIPAAVAPASSTANSTPLDAEQVLVPNSSVSTKPPVAAGGAGSGALTMVGVLGLAGAGGWLLWRGRTGSLKQFNRAPRQLAVEETRSLGNRQFLVVASYQDKKFLIGVCPGRIDLLSALPSSTSVEAEKLRS